MLSLIVHEAWHLEQGVFLALSVLGELEGWQLQYDALKGELGDNPLVYNKNWDKIRNLPSPLSGPVSDDVLWKAEMLILETQDWRHYWIWALPLRPGRLGWETPPRPPMVP